MTKRVYVVVEANWEYNDEYYTRGENQHAGTPKRVFTQREQAEALVRKLNIQEIRGTRLGDYCDEGLRNLLLPGKTEEFLSLLGFKNEDEFYSDRKGVSRTMPDDQVAKVYDCLAISWYEVVETEME